MLLVGCSGGAGVVQSSTSLVGSARIRFPDPDPGSSDSVRLGRVVAGAKAIPTGFQPSPFSINLLSHTGCQNVVAARKPSGAAFLEFIRVSDLDRGHPATRLAAAALAYPDAAAAAQAFNVLSRGLSSCKPPAVPAGGETISVSAHLLRPPTYAPTLSVEVETSGVSKLPGSRTGFDSADVFFISRSGRTIVLTGSFESRSSTDPESSGMSVGPSVRLAVEQVQRSILSEL